MSLITGPVQWVEGSSIITAAAMIQSMAQEIPNAANATEGNKQKKKQIKNEMDYDLYVVIILKCWCWNK